MHSYYCQPAGGEKQKPLQVLACLRAFSRACSSKEICNATWDARVDRHALHWLAPLVRRSDGACVRREAQVEHLRTLTIDLIIVCMKRLYTDLWHSMANSALPCVMSTERVSQAYLALVLIFCFACFGKLHCEQDSLCSYPAVCEPTLACNLIALFGDVCNLHLQLSTEHICILLTASAESVTPHHSHRSIE